MTHLQLTDLSAATVVKSSAALLFAYYIISSIVTWYPLRHIPGPFIAKFSHLWTVYHYIRGTVGPAYLALSKYNSPLVRTGPRYLVTTEPGIFKHANGARSAYGRDVFWETLRVDYSRRSLIDTIDIAEHDRLKAKVSAGYSGRDVDMETIIDGEIAKLATSLRRNHVGKEKVDWANISRFFTLDVITRLAYGKAFGWVEADKDLYGYNGTIDKSMKMMGILAEISWLHPIRRWGWVNRHLKPQATDKEGMGRVIGIGREEVQRWFANEEKNGRDMIGSFMRHGLRVDEIENEALVQIFAGSDTTAIVIRSTILHLVATPRVCTSKKTLSVDRQQRSIQDSKLKTQISNAIASGKVSIPITYAQAQTFPYLQAIIWEGMRMRPAVTYGHFKLVPPGGDTIPATSNSPPIFLPTGTNVGHNHYGMMRNKRIFGEDVEIFRPERYLDQPNGVEMQKTVELVFGAGRWMCAGKQIALMELNKVFWELLRQFDFQLARPDLPGWKETTSFVFQHKEMWLRITEAEE